jgi:hypothetical protein
MINEFLIAATITLAQAATPQEIFPEINGAEVYHVPPGTCGPTNGAEEFLSELRGEYFVVTRGGVSLFMDPFDNSFTFTVEIDDTTSCVVATSGPDGPVGQGT